MGTYVEEPYDPSPTYLARRSLQGRLRNIILPEMAQTMNAGPLPVTIEIPNQNVSLMPDYRLAVDIFCTLARFTDGRR